MKIENIVVICSLLILSSSCNDAPEFPNTPKIDFESIILRDASSGNGDSLILTIRFEDGDGDLGLGTLEDEPPYNQKNYFSNKTGDFFKFGQETLDDLITFANRAEIDSLPAYTGDAICLSWDTNPELFLQDGSQLQDTVYFRFNERHHNIFIDFFIDRGSGFEEFDIRIEADCSTFDGRFPLLNLDDEKRSLEGSLRYGMTSLLGFKSVFGENTLRLKITIVDRAGNFSNAIETPPFRLSEID